MKPREWRERRFVEGAAALRRHLAAIGRPDALPPTGEHYVCPCCMRVHGHEALSNGMLTIEDVPPKSVGGRWLVLTCKQCNSTAGTRLDEQARLREEQLDFFAGRYPTGRLRPRSWLVIARLGETSVTPVTLCCCSLIQNGATPDNTRL